MSCQNGENNLESSKRKHSIHSLRRHSKRRRQGTMSFSLPLLLFCFLTMTCITTTASSKNQKSDVYLNEDSVILITGAAGFLGSELSMALHRTYSPKYIICVDNMDSVVGGSMREEELSKFEFKRQRVFHVMQTLASRGVFYRVDFRPSIPEYFDVGEVPTLDYIVKDHPDITHVVHLAENVHASEQAISRQKEQVTAGMMEALLEQMLQMPTIPHFVYASSYEVYNHLFPSSHNPVPFSEGKPITTPSSLQGASKVVDELLAKAYYETSGIFSVGLRLFSVYGPWSVPGSPLFEMAERAVTDSPVVTMEESDVLQDVRDYVYIDDAVDAMMAAMQYRTPNGAPVVINVGSGVGTSLQQVASGIQDLFPSTNEKIVETSSSSATISYANTERAKLLLGFQARVPLREGLIRLLSWHYDRAFPYGGRPESPTATNPQVTTKRSYIVSQGIASCSPFDKECMRGAPVFPCASECSHDTKCTTSVYDDVLAFSRSLTSKCSTVMYTVDLNRQLAAIPSANMAISTHHSSHLRDGCNIAFVSEDSDLVQRLKREQGFSMSMTAVETFMKFSNSNNNSKSNSNPKVLKHGFWTLVPVSTPTFVTGDEHIFNVLPKLSPGLFFGEATTHAIYCDSNVIFKDIPSLLQEAKMQPYREGTQGATAMLVARQRPANKHHAFGNDDSTMTISVAESLQNAAYRMVRIGVIDEMAGDGYHPLLDSSWVVHALQKEDSRLFRCDVFGEVVQWNVGTDSKAFEFIMSLHDMWSRVITQDNGIDPWWLGDGVVTVPQNYGNTAAAQSRRLEQVDGDAIDTENDGDNDNKEAQAVDEEKAQVVEADDGDNDNKVETGNEEKVQEVVEADAQEQLGGVDAEQDDEADDGDQNQDDVDTGDSKEAADEDSDEGDSNEVVAQDGGVNPEDILEMKKDSNGEDDSADEDDTEDDEEDEKAEAFANEKGDEAEGEDGVVVGDQVAEGEPGQDAAKGFLNAGNERVDVASPGDEENIEQNEEEEGKSDDEMQDDESDEKDQAQAAQKQQAEVVPDRDHSSNDTWMGILSSTSVQYFVRIVPSSEVGATYLDDYKY